MSSESEATPLVLPLSDGHDASAVGGKAINLARLINDGFPVPDGFVVTTAAYDRRQQGENSIPADVEASIRQAYRDVGSPTVAVRSSATAEDLAEASMAGQYETYLDVQGEKDVLAAVARCWRSTDSPRIRAYLEEHAIPVENVAMAVVVQRLIPAEKAGVLFTANPQSGSQHEILIEANWGLGETVVSGSAQPDTLILDRATGALKSCVIADKQVWLEPGAAHVKPLPDEKRLAGCLNSQDVHALWKLGLQVMDHFDAPQDIEWAFAGGKLYLLQSRSVTTLEDAETYEQLLSDTREQLRAASDAGRGDWVRHNIGETLPHPTPLTWSVIRRFMSGGGGFGAMYRQAGFEPAAAIAGDGFLDLVAGRIYMDLSRAPEMFFENFPFTYDLDLLRSNPDAAQGPPTVPSGSIMDRLGVARRVKAAGAKLREISVDFERKLTAEMVPQFVQYVAQKKKADLTSLSTAEWCELWRRREQEVLGEFAPKSLLPSLILAMAIEDLRTFAREQFWNEDPDELTRVFSAAGSLTSEPDKTVASSEGLFELSAGRTTVAEWLEQFGHRAPDEFDLAAPRWREQPEAVAKMAEHMQGATSPLARYRALEEETAARVEQLKASLSPSLRREFDQRLELVHRYSRFREDGKHYLMLGYDLLRDMALEASRRLDIGDGVFLLSIDELHDALMTGIAPLHLIEQRRQLRMAQRRVDLPDVITEDDLASLGEPPACNTDGSLDAFVLSSGTCTGPVRIVHSPQQAGELGEGYVLVCPSTDPSWTPLFVNACGVVLERGGSLSHGAVVARELGVPAVVLPGATRILSEGETITIDTRRNAVLRLAIDPPTSKMIETPPDPDDVRVAADKVPPVVGPSERRSALFRNVFLAIWALFFMAMAIAPETVERVSFGVLDTLLLPIVATAGKPATVALIAATFAVLSMLGQKLFTDNRRLLVAKKRAAALQKEARKLPENSPRRKALQALAGPVQFRVLKAAFIPLAVLLGPMIVSFMWLPQRIDTAVRNAKPGSMVKVTAVIDGDCESPVELRAEGPLQLADSSASQQEIFRIRPVLEQHHRELGKTQSDLTELPWDQAFATKHFRRSYLDEMRTFLAGKMPDQTLSWQVFSPADKAGKWPISLSTSDDESVTVFAVLGEGFAPEPKEDVTVKLGRREKTDRQVQVWRSDSEAATIKEVQIRYVDRNPVQGEGTFWKPLDWFEPNEDTGPIKALFAPWLVLYIAVYVVVMFGLKLVLQVADFG